MRLLLDTHIWIWTQDQVGRLGEACRRMLLNPENRLFISTVSCIELSRLVAMGRLGMHKDLMVWIDESVGYLQATLLPLDAGSAVGSYRLPGLDHRDPVDRLLLASAKAHELCLVTADRVLLDYDHVSSIDGCV